MISGVEDVPDEAYRGLLDYEKQAANWPAASPALPTAAMIGAFSALRRRSILNSPAPQRRYLGASGSVDHNDLRCSIPATAFTMSMHSVAQQAAVGGKPLRSSLVQSAALGDRAERPDWEEFAPDSPLEEGVRSEPVSESRPFRSDSGP